MEWDRGPIWVPNREWVVPLHPVSDWKPEAEWDTEPSQVQAREPHWVSPPELVPDMDSGNKFKPIRDLARIRAGSSSIPISQ